MKRNMRALQLHGMTNPDVPVRGKEEKKSGCFLNRLYVFIDVGAEEYPQDG